MKILKSSRVFPIELKFIFLVLLFIVFVGASSYIGYKMIGNNDEENAKEQEISREDEFDGDMEISDGNEDNDNMEENNKFIFRRKSPVTERTEIWISDWNGENQRELDINPGRPYHKPGT